MIFVTVGSVLPFERLIRALDDWSALHPEEDVFAQIGHAGYVPRHMRYERMLAPADCRRLYTEASLIVAHAGMGTVISAAEIARPIVLLPRRTMWREHTTDHQLHTARWLRGRPGVFIADTEAELEQRIEEARTCLLQHGNLSTTAPEEFTRMIRQALIS